MKLTSRTNDHVDTVLENVKNYVLSKVQLMWKYVYLLNQNRIDHPKRQTKKNQNVHHFTLINQTAMLGNSYFALIA